mmetsp:Transcript_43570/g.123466  ORF Transcript_43570/g.123466 Transcript_43570/m.123466 type:complete len:323 (-) Transcript_43570:838-1806(-)
MPHHTTPHHTTQHNDTPAATTQQTGSVGTVSTSSDAPSSVSSEAMYSSMASSSPQTLLMPHPQQSSSPHVQKSKHPGSRRRRFCLGGGLAVCWPAGVDLTRAPPLGESPETMVPLLALGRSPERSMPSAPLGWLAIHPFLCSSMSMLLSTRDPRASRSASIRASTRDSAGGPLSGSDTPTGEGSSTAPPAPPPAAAAGNTLPSSSLPIPIPTPTPTLVPPAAAPPRSAAEALALSLSPPPCCCCWSCCECGCEVAASCRVKGRLPHAPLMDARARWRPLLEYSDGEKSSVPLCGYSLARAAPEGTAGSRSQWRRKVLERVSQ